jgi:sulfur-carrier protein
MNEQEKTAVIMRLPSTLSGFSGGKSQLLLNAETVEELLGALEREYPLVWEQLCDAQGQVRKKVSIYINNRLVVTPHDLKMTLKKGQEVIVLPTGVNA